MRVRLLVLCVVLLGAALGAAGCSSSGTSASSTLSSGAPGASSSGAPRASSTGQAPASGKAPVGKPPGAGKVPFPGTYNGSGGFKSGSGTTTLTIQPTAKQAA